MEPAKNDDFGINELAAHLAYEYLEIENQNDLISKKLNSDKLAENEKDARINELKAHIATLEKKLNSDKLAERKKQN